jgi:RimJ/RimL family protein N-acetyltransferase
MLPNIVETDNITLTRLSTSLLLEFSHLSLNIHPEREELNPQNIHSWFLTDYPKEPIVWLFEAGYVTAYSSKFDQTEIGVSVHSDHRRKGYGTKAVFSLAKELFKTQRKLVAHIEPWNEASIGLFSKSGFTYEGTLREEVLYNGKYIDLKRYSCFSYELQNLVPSQL